jgi:mannose-6-phosphate isomerase-like protein (cupin superfamily)
MAAAHDLRAPDGSEIRLLVQVTGGSLVHCTLGSGEVTRAVRHRTVEEMWFCVAGGGQVWRRDEAQGGVEDVVDVAPGLALTIPIGVCFQFRAGGSRPLELVIATLPPWPGEDEAVAVLGPWAATV